MNEGSVSLLRMLAGGVLGFDTPSRDPAADTESIGFDSMMEKAFRGELRSELPVRVPPALEERVDATLRPLLSAATDLAASEGIRRALVLVEGRMFRVDVASRSLIDAPGAQSRAVGDIDGVVRAGGSPTAVSASDRHSGPARVVRNTSLLRVLADQPECAG